MSFRGKISCRPSQHPAPLVICHDHPRDKLGGSLKLYHLDAPVVLVVLHEVSVWSSQRKELMKGPWQKTPWLSSFVYEHFFGGWPGYPQMRSFWCCCVRNCVVCWNPDSAVWIEGLRLNRWRENKNEWNIIEHLYTGSYPYPPQPALSDKISGLMYDYPFTSFCSTPAREVDSFSQLMIGMWMNLSEFNFSFGQIEEVVLLQPVVQPGVAASASRTNMINMMHAALWVFHQGHHALCFWCFLHWLGLVWESDSTHFFSIDTFSTSI